MGDVSDLLEDVKFYKAQYGIGSQEALYCVNIDRETRKTREEVCLKFKDADMQYRPSLKIIELLKEAFEHITDIIHLKDNTPHIKVNYSTLIFEYLNLSLPENPHAISNRELLDWEKNKHVVIRAFYNSNAFFYKDGSSITGKDLIDKHSKEGLEEVIEDINVSDCQAFRRNGLHYYKNARGLSLGGLISEFESPNVYARAQREGTLHNLDVERRLALNYVLANTSPESDSGERVLNALRRIDEGVSEIDEHTQHWDEIIQEFSNEASSELLDKEDTDLSESVGGLLKFMKEEDFIQKFRLHKPFTTNHEYGEFNKEDVREELFYLRTALKKNRRWLEKILEN